MSGFYVARADAAGAKVTASETQLIPGPVDVVYPDDLLGTIQETADGAVVVQQGPKDGRRRMWIWRGYPTELASYVSLWGLLESLRSRHRKGVGHASPFIYIRDIVTGKLRTQDLAVVSGSATSGGASTLADTTRTWVTNAYGPSTTNPAYFVELLSGTGAGQVRKVVSNTGTVLTVDVPWTTQPVGGTVYSLYGWQFPWLKARVVDVQRMIRPGGGTVKFDETRFSFVIEDPAYNDVG